MTFLYRGGCLLPFLIIFNFLFGWMFFGFKTWLIIQLVLVLIFTLYSYILSRKIISQFSEVAKNPGGVAKDPNVIDVEGEVVNKEDRPKIV